MNRKEQIKAYLERLGEGEALESVRADFVKEFREWMREKSCWQSRRF